MDRSFFLSAPLSVPAIRAVFAFDRARAHARVIRAREKDSRAVRTFVPRSRFME